ncbi:MAG: thioredoxin family protein [Rhodothermales bacterium]
MAIDVLTTGRFHRATPYEDFVEQMRKTVEAGDEGLDERERKLFEYTKLNLHRTQRAHRTYKVSDELRALIRTITEPQRWLVLTEDWCGDSAQTIPYVAEMAALNPNIELRVLERDQNLDVMDRYLTDGKRSIPILLALDQHGKELFRWGPRPVEAAALVKVGQEAGLEKDAINQRLHLWYGRNRGRAVEAELKALLAQRVARAA